MSNASPASDTPRLRRILFDRLPGEAFDRINWTTVNRAMVRLRGIGWTPEDVASQVLGDYGDGDPAALIVARCKALDGPPPRESTPQPPPVQEVLQTTMGRNEPAADPSQWIARVRESVK